MKLTEIAIDGYKGTRDTRLQNLSSGLNVVFSSNPATRNSVGNFVLDILYGPNRNSASSISAANSNWPNGYVNVQSGGDHFRLARPLSNQIGELAVSDLQGSRLAHRSPDLLSHLDQSVYGMFFNCPLGTGNWDVSHFISQLARQFEVHGHQDAPNMPFAPEQSAFEAWKLTAEARLARVESVRHEINSLNAERARLISERENYNHDYQNRLTATEQELAGLQSRHDSLAASIQTERSLLNDLDRQIGELISWIEHEETQLQHVPVTRPQTNFLPMFYDRLDEIDNQIRRWRFVQSDIQDQRVRLRDEMVTHNELSIESQDHPYHDTRDIVLALEAKVNRTEEIARYWDQSATPVENTIRMTNLCSEMRVDLQALCSELGRQYKHVRHKATVAELKQLRRCYHEMDENVKRLLVRRESVIAEIRQMDPAGADAIVEASQKFTMCAEQDGYLVARQQFVSGPPISETGNSVEYRTVYPDLTNERNQLTEMQTRRLTVAERIASLESEIRSIEPRRSTLIDERNRLAGAGISEFESRIREIDSKLHQMETEQATIQAAVENDRHWLSWKPNYLLGAASRYLSHLTNGSFTHVAIDQSFGVSIGRQNDSSLSLNTLSSVEQSLVHLSLSLAAVAQLGLRGIRLPMLVEDDQNIASTHSVIPTLSSFCGNGHQVILLSPERSLIEQTRHHQATVFDLPDTHIAPPTWVPETPTIPRHDVPYSPTPPATGFYPTQSVQSSVQSLDLPQTASGYQPLRVDPMIKRSWQPASTPQPSQNFDGFVSKPKSTIEQVFSPTPLVASSRNAPSRDTLLQNIDLVESIYLTPIESLGIRTLGQLLDLDLEQHEPDLARRGFNLEQIDRWQAQAWLLVCLPEMSSSDARVLVGSGIDQPEQLLQMNETEILGRIRNFLDSSAGRRSNTDLDQFNSSRIRGWSDRLKANDQWRSYTRSRFRSRSERASRTRSPVEFNRQTSARSTRTDDFQRRSDNRPVTDSIRNQSSRSSFPDRSSRQDARPVGQSERQQNSENQYRFYLNMSDDIEAAPSIGPKAAERFYKIGIQTVSDFLNADAADMASQLENRRMSAKVIRVWQEQSSLMCRVPNLRGHDVQFLVGCKISDPDQFANMNASDLLGKVTSFLSTKEGTRMLRNGKQPDLEEITEWIDAANHVRALKAA